MELRIFTEPQQGATYEQLLTVAQTAEKLGYGAFPLGPLSRHEFRRSSRTHRRMDHARRNRPRNVHHPPRHSGDVGYVPSRRTAGHFGRTGRSDEWWPRRPRHRRRLRYEEEHQAYGIPFPALKDRFELLEETLDVVTGLWRTTVGDTFDYDGKHVQIKNSPALPKPHQVDGPPILIGGTGKKKTPALAARFANEFNIPFKSLEETKDIFARVRQACVEHERDPNELVYSNALVLCCGRDEAEIKKRAEAIGRDVDELRENGLAGTPSELVDKIGTFADAGSQRVYLQTLDLADLDHLELVASEVMPQLQ